jgi:hypothetical protein
MDKVAAGLTEVAIKIAAATTSAGVAHVLLAAIFLADGMIKVAAGMNKVAEYAAASTSAGIVHVHLAAVVVADGMI